MRRITRDTLTMLALFLAIGTALPLQASAAAVGDWLADVSSNPNGNLPAREYVVGDLLYLDLEAVGQVRHGTYRACLARRGGRDFKCWKRNVTYMKTSSIPWAPQQDGNFTAHWYVGGKMVAAWNVQIDVGD